MLVPPRWKIVLGNVVAAMLVLSIGAAGGAALGVINSGGAGAQTPQATNRIAALGDPTPLESSILVVEESARPFAQPAQSTPIVTQAPAVVRAPGIAAPVVRAAVPVLNLPSVSFPPAACDRLDDAKIQWLLSLVAKAKAANPADAAVAGRLDAQVRSGLGQNMCAAEAQSHVSAMCADPAVWSFMQKMVKELPFFVRPLVGDPCTKDLVMAAHRYLP